MRLYALKFDDAFKFKSIHLPFSTFTALRMCQMYTNFVSSDTGGTRAMCRWSLNSMIAIQRKFSSYNVCTQNMFLYNLFKMRREKKTDRFSRHREKDSFLYNWNILSCEVWIFPFHKIKSFSCVDLCYKLHFFSHFFFEIGSCDEKALIDSTFSYTSTFFILNIFFFFENQKTEKNIPVGPFQIMKSNSNIVWIFIDAINNLMVSV